MQSTTIKLLILHNFQCPPEAYDLFHITGVRLA